MGFGAVLCPFCEEQFQGTFAIGDRCLRRALFWRCLIREPELWFGLAILGAGLGSFFLPR